MILVPQSQLDNAQIALIKQRAAASVKALFKQNNQNAPVIYRQLLASDVLTGSGAVSVAGRLANPNGLTANVLAADQWTTWTLPNLQALAIYGYVALSPQPLIDEIDLWANNVPLARLQMDEMYAQANPIGYCSRPILFQGTEHVRVDLLAGAQGGSGTTVAALAEQFMFLGFVAEGAGRNVVADRDLVTSQQLSAAMAETAPAGG